MGLFLDLGIVPPGLWLSTKTAFLSVHPSIHLTRSLTQLLSGMRPPNLLSHGCTWLAALCCRVSHPHPAFRTLGRRSGHKTWWQAAGEVATICVCVCVSVLYAHTQRPHSFQNPATHSQQSAFCNSMPRLIFYCGNRECCVWLRRWMCTPWSDLRPLEVKSVEPPGFLSPSVQQGEEFPPFFCTERPRWCGAQERAWHLNINSVTWGRFVRLPPPAVLTVRGLDKEKLSWVYTVWCSAPGRSFLGSLTGKFQKLKPL